MGFFCKLKTYLKVEIGDSVASTYLLDFIKYAPVIAFLILFLETLLGCNKYLETLLWQELWNLNFVYEISLKEEKNTDWSNEEFIHFVSH